MCQKEVDKTFTMVFTYGLFALLISSTHALLFGGSLKCRHGWVRWQNYCYMFSVDKDSWGNAEIRCRAFGGYLAEIHDAETNTFLKNHLKALHYDDHTHYYYIGLTDAAQTGVWEWVHSQSLPNFTDWRPGEGQNHANQDCTILNGADAFLWHDEFCTISRRFICQEKPTVISN